MEMDILRGELARLFSLDELTALSRDLLGFDPQEVGGTAAKASFAKALTDLCAEVDAVEALVDAVLASRAEADPRLREMALAGILADEELASGASVGPFTVTRKVGDDSVGILYETKREGKRFAVKVLRQDVTRDRRALNRFLALTRLISRLDHAGLPKQVEIGQTEDGRHHYIAWAWVDAQPLSARIARSGAMHFNEAKPILESLLDVLAALHAARITHGHLTLENLLVARGPDGSPQVTLIGVGEDRLRLRARRTSGPADLISTLGSAKTMAPEQVLGRLTDARTDVYAVGAIAYEILTGKPVFQADSPVDRALAHVARDPAAPSTVAPRGWVTPALDDFVLALLNKDPAARPQDARAVLEALEAFGRASGIQTATTISDEDINARVDALLAAPDDENAAVELEATVDQGAEPTRIAEAFAMAADQVDAEAQSDIKKSLLFRAARIYETAKQLDKAEQMYVWITEADGSDDVALAALEEVRKRQGKFAEVVEMLLARSEAAESRTERARAFAEIGRICLNELEDPQQAVVAFTQAFCEDAHNSEYADQLERAAGNDPELWNEVLTSCSEATQGDLPSEVKNLIFVRLGRWYEEKAGRLDMAVACYQAILATEPANEKALLGMTNIYRKAQQWPELGTILLHRADAAATPAQARDLRAEAAELLENKLNDAARARDLYLQIFEEDPGHARAAQALARLLERAGDYTGLVEVLNQRAEALRGDEKLAALARIAEVYEDRLDDLNEARNRYEAILESDPNNLEALKGLDRIYSRTGKYRELLGVLEQQIASAATPRQKITLLERIAGIYDEEFLDHGLAAEACEKILELDASHEPTLTQLARHYRALNRWEDVVAVYERHLAIVTENARRIEVLLLLGRVLAEQIGSPERATSAYEKVLEIEPNHANALEALARLRELSGDAHAALSAIEALAEKAQTPEAKAEQFMRAAKLLESRGDRDGAIQRYKLALDANPKDKSAAAALRAAYTARGDASAAIELIVQEIETVEGNLQKARLFAEMAVLAKERLKDDDRAEAAAKQAIENDPTNLDALTLLGDIAFERGRFVEATSHYDSLAGRISAMSQENAKRVLIRYIDALAKAGSTEKAIGVVENLLQAAPGDREALERAALVVFEHGEASEARKLYDQLLTSFGEELAFGDKAVALYRLGESARRAGDFDAALAALKEAVDMDASSADASTSLAKVYEEKGDWDNAIKVRQNRLDLAVGEERHRLLVEIGDILATKLDARARAAKMFVAALEEKPDDRKLLTRLMQLYSEEKDWSKLVEVVLKLSDFVEDPKQQAKYVHTAAIVSARQLEELDKALEYYERALELDPDMVKAQEEAIDLYLRKGDATNAERLLKSKLEKAKTEGDRDKQLATLEALGSLYKDQLGNTDAAIETYETAQSLDPENREREQLLAELYASNPLVYLDKAVAAQTAIIHKNPYKADSYKALRKLYTEAKRADAAFCLCQALYVLKQAEPDEERFFQRMRSDTAAPAQDRLLEEDWLQYLVHEDADPVLTGIFMLIEPAIIAARTQPLEALGYDPSYMVDLASHPYTMSQTLYYAAGVLGMEAPPTFENTNDPGGLSFLHAQYPSVVLGHAALAMDVPPQTAAFIVARHLVYYRPGFYVRHLVPTGTGLKAWLFAAIKLISPQFPVSPDIEGQVKENVEALSKGVTGPAREQLASLVTKLLQGAGSLDLKRWVAAIDLTADRAGFLVAHDLEVANEVIEASGEDASSVPVKERQKDLLLFSVNEKYFTLRERLGIGIGD